LSVRFNEPAGEVGADLYQVPLRDAGVEPIRRYSDVWRIVEEWNRSLNILPGALSCRFDDHVLIRSDRSEPLRLATVTADDHLASTMSAQRSQGDLDAPALDSADTPAVTGDEYDN